MRAKLILSLVFVFIIAGICSYNYLRDVEAADLVYNETFLTTTKKDPVETNARWLTSGEARLWGQEATNMAESANGFENISDLTENASNTDIKVGTDNIAYAIWEREITPGFPDIFFAKYTSGVGWTDMDGTLGEVNISNTPGDQSVLASLALDSNNVPYIIWSDYNGGLHLRLRRWNTTAVAWTDMAGTGSTEVFAHHLSYGQIRIDSADNIYLVSEGSSSIVFSTWSGGNWQGLTGNPNYDSIGSDLRPRIELDNNGYPYVVSTDILNWFFTRWDGSSWVTMSGAGGSENISQTNSVSWGVEPKLVLDSANNPYFVWVDGLDGDEDIFLTHWTGTAWESMSGLSIYEDVSQTTPGVSTSPDLKLDTSNNPYIVWREAGNEIYFTKWSGSAWTNIAGGLGSDNISSNAGISRYPLIQLNSADEVFVVWTDYTTGAGDIYFVRGVSGSSWKNINNIVGFTNLTDDTQESVISNPFKIGDNFLLGADEKLYLLWKTKIAANYAVSFTKIIPDYQTPAVLQSIKINSGTDLVLNATLTATEGLDGSIAYSLSNDGGATWESATKNVLHTFISEGNDLRWKADLTGTTSVTPVIDSLDISYETKKIYCSIDAVSLTQGSQQTIRATLSFTPPDPSTDVWATIEKDGVLLSTVIMSNAGGNDYVGTYTTGEINLGQNDVAVLANDGTTTYACNPSLGVNWQKTSQNDIPWHRRNAQKAVSFAGKMWVMGGLVDAFTNDIWNSTDGLNWTEVAAGPHWDPRGYFELQVLNGRMWVMGGLSYVNVGTNTYYGDVWYTDDGINWVHNPAYDLPFNRTMTASTVYDDGSGAKIWLFGGYNGTAYTNDLWSFDGTTWTEQTIGNKPPLRTRHQMLTYDGKLWVLGGRTTGIDINDVWYWDGTDPNWTQVTTIGTTWSIRGLFAALTYDDGSGEKMYIMGGENTNTGVDYNDVWTSPDGANWTKIFDNPDNHQPVGSIPSSWASWSARRELSGLTFNNGTGNKIWVMGGWENRVKSWNDVWNSSDGIDWNSVGTHYDAIFGTRFEPQMVTFDNKLWVIGGLSVTNQNDVWTSTDGNNWTCLAGSHPGCVNGAPGWDARYNHNVVVYNGELWLYGGCASAAYSDNCSTVGNRRNDLWHSSDGVTWNLVTPVTPLPTYRYWPAVSVYDDGSGSKIWVTGGRVGVVRSKEVWTYDSVANSWAHLTDATWTSGREAHKSVVFNDGINSKLIIAGGYNGTVTRLSDVWAYDPAIVGPNKWVLQTATPGWVGRYGFGFENYNDKIWILGGQQDVKYLTALFTDEVWSSADAGVTWVNVTSDAEFDGRDFFDTTIYNDRIWFTGGDSNVGTNNDVWASSYDYTDLSFTVSPLPSPGGNPAPDAPGNVVPPCQAVDVTENNTIVKAINWNFHDNATNEIGFRLYEVGSGSEILKLEVATPDINVIQEKTNLTANQPYTRTVKAYNSNGTSVGTTPATCYTLANVPNKVKITNITADSVTIALDPNDGNPPETLYAIRVISGTETNFVNPDGSFSPTEAWHTYAEFGGIDGIDMTGLTPGQNYSFSAKAKNGDTLGIETAYSDISNSIPQPEIAPNISATKGVAVNLAWNSSFSLFSTAWAGGNLVIDSNGTLNRTLGALAWLLNIILLILLAIFGISLVKTLKHLKHEYKYPDTFKLIWSIITKEAHQTYIQHAPQTQEGVYHSSTYHQHKKLHNLSRHTFLGAGAVIGLKLIILVVLTSGLVTLNHSGLAATAPYNQSGTNVNVGDTLSYIVEVSNTGTDSAQDIVISDVLSSYLTYGSGTSGITYDSNTNTITYSISSLAINEKANMTFKATVISGSEGEIITNTANISGGNFTGIASNPTSNQVRSAIPINANINQPPINENINQSPINENINQVPTNENTNQPVITNGNINQPPEVPPASGSSESQVPIVGPIIDSVTEIFEFLAQIEPFKSLNELVLDNPQVEQASQNVITPLIITVAVINTLPAVLLITTYLLPYLHLIFLEPLLLLFGKKRKKWGVVYNSLTKKPVDLALVRLYNKETNQLVQTKVTDREGRYIMIAKDPGKYYLSVTKPGFITPSSYLRGETQDTKYIDLYHGEVIEVTEKDAVLTANIPLDPAEKKTLAFAEIIRAYLLKNLRLVVSYVGLILSLIIVLIIPTAITIGALVIHLLLFLFFRRFLVPPKPKSWGIVYDAKTKEPLGSSVVRIFDMKFNQLLETQVTDSKGRYSFLVSKNEYQMLAEKPGYQNKEVKPVDLVKNEDIVNLDVGLNKI